MRIKIALIVIISIAIGFIAGGGLMGNEYELTHTNEKRIVVESGDSLWDFMSIISNRNAYDGHDVINYVVEYNQLHNKSVSVGQVLYIPTELKEIR